MTNHCHYDRWKVIHRCLEAEILWNAVYEAHALCLANNTPENLRQFNTCWHDYQAHIKSCTTLEGIANGN